MAGTGGCTNETESRTRIASCEECGLKFDSITSLEVHLSYHKENLLQKWGRESREIESKNTFPLPPDYNISLSNPILSPQLTMNRNGHSMVYLPSFNKNTLQFYTSPSLTYSSGEIHGFPNGSNPESSIHSFQTHMPLPNSLNPDMDHQNKHEKLCTDVPAEILDLDSNTVHVVNNQVNHPLDNSNHMQFYRPFLNGNATTTMPTMTSCNTSTSGSWGFVMQHQHEPERIKHYELQLQPSTSVMQGPTPHVPSHSHGHDYSQPEYLTVEANQNSLSAPAPARPVHAAPEPKQEFPQQNDEGNAPNGQPAIKYPNKTETSEGNATATPGKYVSKDSSENKSNSTATKTKGWKGGECKRPKTYNCTACNKWFTSSGHLKRHYGTTLHKNSIRQLGEESTPQKSGDPVQQNGSSVKKKQNASNKKNGNATKTNRDKTTEVADLKNPNSSNSGDIPRIEFMQRNGPGPEDKELLNGAPPHSLEAESAGAESASRVVLQAFTNCNAFEDKFQHQLQKPLEKSQNRSFEEVEHIPFSYAYNPQFQHVPFPPATVAPITDNGIYNGLNGGYNINGGLPPFSSVGYSHYDGHIFPHLNSNLGHHPNLNNLNADRSGLGSPIIANSLPNLSQVSQNFGPGNPASPEVNRSASADMDFNSPQNDSTNTSNSTLQELVSSGSESEEAQANPNELFQCSLCSKTFGRACYLTQHINGFHSEYPHKCATCGKRFIEETALSVHMQKHGDDKPYHCDHDQCSKQFNHKTDLRRHLCFHTGEKPFLCKTCGKGFIRKDHMNKHSETHMRKGGR